MLEIRTLVVEDDDRYALFELEMLRSVGEPKFIAERVIRLKDAKDRLTRTNFDLVLLDLFLPDSSELGALIEITHSFPLVPIVILTGIGDESMGIEAIKEGANDYLLKDQLTQRLFPRVLLYAIERKRNEVEKLKLLENERKARIAAEHAVKSRDAFLLIASHELLTPLTCLQMQIQLFRNSLEGKLAAESGHFKSLTNMSVAIEYDIQRFGSLINTLMEFSQFQLGKIVLHKNNFNLTTLVKEVIMRLGNELRAAGCKLHVIGDSQVTGQWDRMRFEEVISNLLMNAVKYAPGSTIYINITSDRNTARLEIQDNGPGIPDDAKARIFDQFERATSRKGVPGLGLGLYIVQQIIRSHHGTISVQSTLGKGTTFIIQVPKVQANSSNNSDDTYELKRNS